MRWVVRFTSIRFTPAESSWCPLIKMLGGFQSRSEYFGEEKLVCSLPGIEQWYLDCPPHSLVTRRVPSGLCRRRNQLRNSKRLTIMITLFWIYRYLEYILRWQIVLNATACTVIQLYHQPLYHNLKFNFCVLSVQKRRSGLTSSNKHLDSEISA